MAEPHTSNVKSFSYCVRWPDSYFVQALKANPDFAPKELKVNANYIGRFGQVALTEALDMVYEMGGGREIVITY